jgi:hypothetical protein
MADGRTSRATITRGLLASAIVLVMLTILFAAGVFPLAPGMRMPVIGVLAFVAVTNVLVALLFSKKTP